VHIGKKIIVIIKINENIHQSYENKMNLIGMLFSSPSPILFPVRIINKWITKGKEKPHKQ
jgi:hypothetical protein